MKNNLTLEQRSRASDFFEAAVPDLTDAGIVLGYQLGIYGEAYHHPKKKIKFPNPELLMALIDHKDSFMRVILDLTEDELILRPVNEQNLRPNLDDCLQRLSLVFGEIAKGSKLTYENNFKGPIDSDPHLIYTALADMIQYVHRVLGKDAEMVVSVDKFKDPKGQIADVPSEYAAFKVHTTGGPRRYDILDRDNVTALAHGFARIVSAALGGHFRVTPKPRAEILDVTFYHPLGLQEPVVLERPIAVSTIPTRQYDRFSI